MCLMPKSVLSPFFGIAYGWLGFSTVQKQGLWHVFRCNLTSCVMIILIHVPVITTRSEPFLANCMQLVDCFGTWENSRYRIPPAGANA